MTHAPPISPKPALHPPTAEPLRVEWVSQGFEGIDILAWLNARQNLKSPVGHKRAMALLVYYIILACIGLLILSIGIVLGRTVALVLAVFLLLISAIGMIGALRLLSPAKFQAKVIKIARKSNTIESTAGHWSCEIDHGRVEFEWLDRGHLTRIPSAEITEVAIVYDRVVLLAGEYLRGFFPIDALPPGDPEIRVRAALRHVPAETEPTH